MSPKVDGIDNGAALDVVVSLLSQFTESSKSMRILLRSADQEGLVTGINRGYIESRSLGVVRFLNTIDYIIMKALGRREVSDLGVRDRSLLRLATYEGRWPRIPLDVIRSTILDTSPHLAETAVRAVELDLESHLRNLSQVKALSLGLSHPTFLVKTLLENLPQTDAINLMRRNNGSRDYFLRVNRLLEGHETVIRNLEDKGIKVEPDPKIPSLFRLGSEAQKLFGMPEFANGQVLVQDKGSVAVAYALGPRPGMTVWDACAAPGMKTQLLWELMECEGVLHATDINSVRLERAKKRATLLGYDKVRFSEADAVEAPIEDADLILIDAPCTSTGMLRSHPSYKWRLNKKTLFSLMSIQNKILDGVLTAYANRPGTEIVYATCSLLPHEGESQIDSAMTRHSFDLLEIPLEGSKGYAGFECSDEVIRLSPDKHNSNGFFIAKLRITG
ncbi:MAG: RsmB/NOP family class I SAM-dependent RNA methyltransferase [Candidatus Thorarchaeota archaeon]|nr:MAG: RsmB/NOP family class I SAM-dependent RNA methyltransferase [Candidatus Thorarchaeota archaeon]